MKDREKKRTPRKNVPTQDMPVNSDDLGMEQRNPSNYENSLVGNPKDLTGFEVNRSPGRLG